MNPFAAVTRGLTEPNRLSDRLREAGPVVVADAPAGGPVWIVTDEELAKQVLSDPRIVKDPAMAPADWDPLVAGLEPPASAFPSLTTVDGPRHTELRRAHTPLLTGKRIREQTGRIEQIARDMLAAQPNGVVDLMVHFTIRYPLTVLLDLLGIPLDKLDATVVACRRLVEGDQSGAIPALMEIAGTAGDDGLAAELRGRLPEGTPEQEVRYHLFGLIFAGQVTTDAALGFVIAHALGAPDGDPVEDALRRYTPAPFSLWRFTSEPLEINGVSLPARAPVLVDLVGLGLTFGSGPHFCIGAQLAQAEMRALVTVLRRDFPEARLAVPFDELVQIGVGGIGGTRLRELPVSLR
ncbi:cytochrome P450 [Kibdelosporangium persicum]|uniref:Cytochrome n=1 Tax=Kibdelosporangium persicum TaxID=2698649 RepID=A0ABX2EWY0_9PSEU|nr:cytochrome P450 [Kibdelosporangium persicum]NRN63502.1 Cytochrome [Kibdelosporangium persicum]